MTRAAQDFAISLADAHRLFAYYDAELARFKPRIPEEAEVLKRAALIMAVTAFESYIEDYLRETVPPRLSAALTPEKFKLVFEVVAKKWLKEHPDNHAAGISILVLCPAFADSDSRGGDGLDLFHRVIHSFFPPLC